jgi:hypothetical protein
LRFNNLFIGRKQALEALEIPEKLYFNLLVKLGSNFSTNWNRIRLNLQSYIAGYFWHCKHPNWENSISQ